MSEDKDALIAQLRAENLRLNAIAEQKQDENAQKFNMGLARVAQHAAVEGNLAMIQSQGASIQPGMAGTADPVAMEAAGYVLADWGLI